jgi:hypothetical protein
MQAEMGRVGGWKSIESRAQIMKALVSPSTALQILGLQREIATLIEK